MKLPFHYTGIVVKGKQLGRTIGFPTANILPDPEKELPLNNGVYAVVVRLAGSSLPGMANVGVKPTLGLNQLTIEIHLFDFNEDIYGENLDVTFHEFIRVERKFAGLDALKEQIGKDEEVIRGLLSDRM
jgi:riboflavin kinase/FMN adenylyltransferase